jgi:hypothetical protein
MEEQKRQNVESHSLESEFVTYEQALALKELGFDDISWFDNQASLYDVNGEHTMYTNYGVMYSGLSDGYIPAPLKQQVFRWFREKYNLHHIVIWDSDNNNFDAGLFGELVIPFLEEDTIFSTYEEAENACIDKLIEIAKKQDK